SCSAALAKVRAAVGAAVSSASMLTIFLVLLTASFLCRHFYRSPQRPSGPKRGRQIGAPSAPDEDGGLLGICFLRTSAESSISSQAGHRDRAAEPHHSDNGS